MSNEVTRGHRIAARRPAATQEARGTRTTTVRSTKGTVDTEQEEAVGDAVRFPPDRPPAYVSVAVGQTVKIGEFEFLRMDVAVSLPVFVEDIETGYAEASDFAGDKLNEEYNRWLGKPAAQQTRGSSRR